MTQKKDQDWIGKVNHTPSTGQATIAVTVGTTATLLSGVNANREKILIYNNSATIVYLGGEGVTTSTGIPLVAKAAYSDEPPGTDIAAIYAVVATGTANVRIREYI